MNRSLLFVLFCLWQCAASGQNLIKNGKFDANGGCPGWQGDIEKAYPWTGVPYTTDFFHQCATSSLVSSPKNGPGFQAPYYGEGYAGIIVYMANYGYYDYLIGTIDATKLVTGKKYCFSMKVSLAENSPYATDRICVYTTKSKTDINSVKKSLPKVITPVGEIMKDTKQWKEIKGEFIADAKETYVWIGGCMHDSVNRVKVNENQNLFNPDRTVYYYISDVRLVADTTMNFPVIATAQPDCQNMYLQMTAGISGRTYNWSNGATTQSIVVNQPGFYAVDVEMDGYCKTYSSSYHYDPDPAYYNLNHFYPNPGIDKFYLNYHSNQKRTLEFNIYDEVGRLIHTWKPEAEKGLNKLELNLGQLAPGVYYIRTADPCIGTSKIVKS